MPLAQPHDFQDVCKRTTHSINNAADTPAAVSDIRTPEVRDINDNEDRVKRRGSICQNARHSDSVPRNRLRSRLADPHSMQICTELLLQKGAKAIAVSAREKYRRLGRTCTDTRTFSRDECTPGNIIQRCLCPTGRGTAEMIVLPAASSKNSY